MISKINFAWFLLSIASVGLAPISSFAQDDSGRKQADEHLQSELDKIDIKDLLSGYDPVTKAITDFIQITTSGTSSIVKIDANGLTGGTAWTQIATLENITGLTDELALKNAGTIIA